MLGALELQGRGAPEGREGLCSGNGLAEGEPLEGVGAGINGQGTPSCTCRIAGFSASMTSTWDSMSEISAGEPAQRPLHHGSNHFFWTTFSV